MDRSSAWAPLRSPGDSRIGPSSSSGGGVGGTPGSSSVAEGGGGARRASNVWLKPTDVRTEMEEGGPRWWNQIGDICVVLSGITLLVTGISLLLGGDFDNNEDTYKVPLPNTPLQPPSKAGKLPSFTWPYILSTLTLELLCLSATGIGLCCVALTYGRNSVVHSLSAFSLINDTCLVLVYTASAVWGNLVLWKLLAGEDWTMTTEDWTFGQSLLFFYVLLTTLLASSYALSRIPTFIGICKFGIHQVRRKLAGGPVVEFYKQYNAGDEFYVRVVPENEYADFVAHMPNPLLTPANV